MLCQATNLATSPRWFCGESGGIIKPINLPNIMMKWILG